MQTIEQNQVVEKQVVEKQEVSGDTIAIQRKEFNVIMQFVSAVKRMREAQRQQFASKKPVDIKHAKECEADVDAYLTESIFKAGSTSKGHIQQPATGNQQPAFNEDTIGQLIQAKVKHQNLILRKEEQLQGITDHQSDAAIQLFEDIQDLKYDLTSIDQALIAEKEKHKTFLQNRLTQYRHELHDNMKPHEQEELSNLINATVRKIGELDTELKKLQGNG